MANWKQNINNNTWPNSTRIYLVVYEGAIKVSQKYKHLFGITNGVQAQQNQFKVYLLLILKVSN